MAKRFNSKAEFHSKAEFTFVDKHRDTVSELICDAAKQIRGGTPSSAQYDLTACIFSGGNANDLSLGLLLKHFSKVTVVGSETTLLKRAVTFQGIDRSDEDRLELIGGTDMTGISHRLEDLSEKEHQSKLADLILDANNANWSGLPKSVDLNASVCFLSELVMKLVDNIGENHAQFVPLVQAVRQRHLQLMLDQLRPGGIGLLIFDFVSSDTLSALPSLEGEELERTLVAAIDNNNFFHGLNPQIILHLFDKVLRDQIIAFQFCKPWVWKTSERSYAVTGVMFQKKLT